MVKAPGIRSYGRALVGLSELFATPLVEFDGCIVISGESESRRHLSSFSGDPVGFEAFVNHIHLDDVLTSAVGRPARREMITIGEHIIKVWSERLRGILRGRSILFYLGGSRGVTLRFHVARNKGAEWMSLDDKAFRSREKMTIFRLTEAGLRRED
jgi:hypothetical protein